MGRFKVPGACSRFLCLIVYVYACLVRIKLMVIKVMTVSTRELLPANTKFINCVDNLVALGYLNESSVLCNLQYRYHRDVIYTIAGPVQLAINPFKDVSVSGSDVIMAYREKILDSPHVYVIADAAYSDMMRDGVNHYIIIRHLKQRGKRKLDQRVKMEEKKLAESSEWMEAEQAFEQLSSGELEEKRQPESSETINVEQDGKPIPSLELLEKKLPGSSDMIKIEQDGERIPSGEGYTEAIREIEHQSKNGTIKKIFDDIILACGSGGTVAGLSIATWLSELKAKVNILTHTNEISISSEQQLAIEELKKKHKSQDEKENNANLIECGNGADDNKDGSTLNERGYRGDTHRKEVVLFGTYSVGKMSNS
ncbi:myosin-2 isoform X1 [Tanacetum coccineum]|uniref:Myosin-2 isoform X1 n=1 Tax=Tanacetum coccineum TaxID=301880 RepID=A0ABQ4Z9T2_9ASTR